VCCDYNQEENTVVIECKSDTTKDQDPIWLTGPSAAYPSLAQFTFSCHVKYTSHVD
jgi:hypothetical protein